MIADALNLLTPSTQAFTAGTTVMTDKIDLGDVTPNRRVGDGEPLALVAVVKVAAAGVTDTTQIQVATDGDAALGSPSVVATRTIPNAQLTLGSVHVLNIPPNYPAWERYLGGRVVLGAGDTLSLQAMIVPLSFIEKMQYYAKGYVNS